jgi:anthranilate phosphoribosyltransferase
VGVSSGCDGIQWWWMVNIKRILKDYAYQNKPLSFDEGYELGLYALEGCAGNQLAQIQSVAALCALHNLVLYKAPGAHQQIAGICSAIFEHDIAKSPSGFLTPDVSHTMDNCGMGGDLIVTANVSTLAALIAATAGISICKHGSPANADHGHHGSSDFVQMLGINTMSTKAQVERSLKQENFAYTEALDIRYKRIHLQTHQFAMLPHMNDIIGPITNPVHPRLLTKRVLGVNHLISPRVVAEAYKVMNERGVTNLEHGLFVRGFAGKERYAGMDEISICAGGTRVAELKDGVVYEFDLEASDFGILEVGVIEIISPPKGISKGEFSISILQGRTLGPPRRMVLANAAALFFLEGRCKTWREGYLLAEEVLSSGRVCNKVQALQQTLSL